ncbi:MATE family efflux transporter [Sphingomonas solaris]|uniref:MATE family efflux transporter n=1 Tax=Alterirhizorhabdus solaris TaxID=2529389 RepID=UPI001396A29A|nr:MATE family efflux transporter [Sphingomonas solaris]
MTSGPSALTSGPVVPALLLYALPVLGANALQSLNASINAIWVGHYLGGIGLAATSNANLVIFLLYSVMFGLSTAVSVMVGQHVGRGDVDGARRVTGSGFTLFVAISIGVGIAGWMLSPRILDWLGTPAQIVPYALPYLRMMFVGLPATLMTIAVSMIVRGAGDSVTPLLAMLPGIVVEIVANPILIRGYGPIPAMGTAGSALATALAGAVTIAILLAAVYARDRPVRLREAEWAYLRPSASLVRVFVLKGVPLGLQMLVIAGSSLVMMSLVNRHGTATIAAFGAANQLWAYVQMPAIAIGMAISGMVAQNIGAGAWGRVDRIAYVGVAINAVATGMLVILTALFDGPLLRFFLPHDPGAIAIAQHLNLLASWSFILQGSTLAMSSVVRANGAVVVPLIALFVAFGPGRIGAALVLEPVLGVDALWWSFPLGAAISMILNGLYYRYGGWRAPSPLGGERAVALPAG